jgi:hypothetical protein
MRVIPKAALPKLEIRTTNPRSYRAGSSAVERWPYKPDVAGSSPVPPTLFSSVSSVGQLS